MSDKKRKVGEIIVGVLAIVVLIPIVHFLFAVSHSNDEPAEVVPTKVYEDTIDTDYTELVASGAVVTAVGIDLNWEVSSMKEWRQGMLDKYPQANYHDVRVELNGEQKFFTYQEFYGALGFDTSIFNN